MRSRPFRIAAAVSLMLFMVTWALAACTQYMPWVISRHTLGDFRVEVLRGKLSVAGPMTYVYPSAGKTMGFAGFRYMTSPMQSIVTVPLWSVLLVTAASFLLFRRLARVSEKPGRCPTCGYDLRATPARCPECGTMPAGAKA